MNLNMKIGHNFHFRLDVYHVLMLEMASELQDEHLQMDV